MNRTFQRITQTILDELKQGVAPWVKPWTARTTLGMPRNYVTDRPYSGVNVLLVWLHMDSNGFTDSRYLTANQINTLGGHFKGQRPVRILFAAPRESKRKRRRKDRAEPALEEEEDDDTTETRMVFKLYNVWNVEQVQGVTLSPEPAPPTLNVTQPAAHAFMQALGADIKHGGTRASYHPTRDLITLPHPNDFESEGAYLATALHELIHWTGHETRLAREFGAGGTTVYAFEELIAELGSAYLCAQLGVPGKLQHASYIQHWITLLEQDERALVRAAAAATRAAQYLSDGRQSQHRKEAA